MGASPDGLVTDPSKQQPHGLVEIKCPARADKLSLFDLCTKKEYKPTFCLQHADDKYELQKQKATIIRSRVSSILPIEISVIL